MKPKIKIAAGVLVTLLFLSLGIVAISYFVLKSYVPDYTGELRFSDVQQKVEIYRDSLGIPYIVAKNETDAAFALGFVHAQERMFQMDLYRRAALGKLSEVIGSKTVKVDRMFRTIGITRAAKAAWQKLDPVSKKILTAYSNGVNAYLHSTKWHSVEFDLLNYEPQDWKPEHSIAIAKLIAWELNMGWWGRILEAHLQEKFSQALVNEIFPHSSDDVNYSSLNNSEQIELPKDFLSANILAKEILGFSGSHLGSNNWVVNGKHSVTGKPLIANDTHLAFSLPDQWFVAVMRTKALTVAGFTLPGVPGVLIGENGRIAWTETNLMSDDALFFLEKVNPAKEIYFKNGKWKKLKVLEDTIAVKDSANAVFKIYSTENGVIISDSHLYTFLFPDSIQNKTFLSMHFPALNSTTEFLAIRGINLAANWEEFKNALKLYTYPGQNFVFADSTGNIGYVCGVKLIDRKPFNSKGLLDGTSFNQKISFVKFKNLPKVFNPKEGYFATANNNLKVFGRYHIADFFEPPARFQRIISFLASKDKFSLEDFKQMQSDVYSNYPKEFVASLLKAFRKVKIKDENLKLALRLLKNWDFKFGKYSQPAAIYSVFFQKLLTNTFEDEMGKNLFHEFLFFADIPFTAAKKLLNRPYSFWWDDKSTPKRETRDVILRNSLADALDYLEGKFGRDVSQWQWRNLHKLTLKHPFHGRNKLIDALFDVGPFDVGGCGTSLFNTEFSFAKPYDVVLGQAMRFLYDLSEPNVFYFTLPSGESGHVLSPHYGETTKDWLMGKYYKVRTDYDNFKNFEKLILLPQ